MSKVFSLTIIKEGI